MNKVALGMIVKDDSEVDNLTRCLNSVAPFVDGIFLTVTQEPNEQLKKLASRYGANIQIKAGEFNYQVKKEEVDWLKDYLKYDIYAKEGDTIFNFGPARQSNLESVPDEFDWYFWMDTDDVLRNGSQLKQLAQAARQNNIEAVFMNYIYQAELDDKLNVKNIIIQHLRERLVRVNGDYRKVWKWEGSIHETLVQQRETVKVESDQMGFTTDILHLSHFDKMNKALDRNMKVLELEVFKTKGRDPRPLYYLAKAHFDLHTPQAYEVAKRLIGLYLSPDSHARNMSGWKEERSQAWEYLAEIYKAEQSYQNAIKALHNALIEYPQFASTYFSLAHTHMLKEEWDTARFWAILASKVPPSKSTLVTNPRDIQTRAYEVFYNSGIRLNKIDEAWAACQKLSELFPNDPVIQGQWKFINETKEVRDQLKNFTSLVRYLDKTGEQGKIKAMLAGAPQEIANNPIVVKMFQEMTPPRDWGSDEVALYCGPQFTQWGPESLENTGNSFIGGSEEAVIYLAEAMARQGLKVTVFADPGTEKEVNGVTWKPYFQFNPRDNFNVLVYWRAVAFIDMGVNSKKTYLWCHDVQNQAEYSKERLDRLTKVIVLSQAHRQNIPDVPDEKIFISSNGYTEHHPEVKPTNNPKWCIWTSSYDRGLEHILEIWPQVTKKVPDAQLHIFYGWKLFKQFNVNNPERMAWMRKIEGMMQQDGVVHHDRVSQPEMEKWYKQCGLWTYPTHFYEISCISAMKAQAYGAVPVVINEAALKETVQFGKKIKGDIWDREVKDKYTKELIKSLNGVEWQDKERGKMIRWARENFSWNEVAKNWKDEFTK